MHSIHKVAERYKVTYDALRYYEKKGLLPPIKRDSQGRREYSDTDLVELDKLIHLRKLGASVNETKQMLMLSRGNKLTVEACEEALALLQRLNTKLDQRIAETETQKIFLQKKTALFKEKLFDLTKRETLK
ncbi:MerR family transcriptional regulator [Loigolactobacillus coryniformis]|uniref:MerR family transcriptional regulator n=1 Tax=Loigolactobacillus coryniformis TaxID=1610 RepID=A0A5B8TKC7_9LACO|nr:MerR family transcriptional regulator [Loigolactobacillus coryniformis]QEA52831.1 MerR family transcriptional regulator [Loigolactobacillus coryniformis]